MVGHPASLRLETGMTAKVPMKRRDFLRAAAGAAVGVQMLPRRVLGAPGTPGPNSRIRLAAIGAGGQAAADLNEMSAEHIVAW